MKAIILAAGKSTRLYPITLERPKCLLEVGGMSIVDRQIDSLKKVGINEILAVVGYRSDVIRKEVGNKVIYREYNNYNEANNLHTLWSVREELEAGFLCLFSDVLFEVEIIKRAVESSEDFCMIIDTGKVLKDTMRIMIEDGKLKGIGSHISVEEGSGNFIGIAKFSREGSKILLNRMGKMISGHENDYYTVAIDDLAKEGTNIGYVDVKDKTWIEIDTEEDLNKAKQIIKYI